MADEGAALWTGREGFAARLAVQMRAFHEAARAERERHIFWVPVALGTGIALYFALPVEPPPAFTALGFALATAVCFLLADSGKWVGLGLVLILAGMGLAQLRTTLVAAPILKDRTGPVRLEATVDAVEDMTGGAHRLLLAGPQAIETDRAGPVPDLERLRLTVRTDMADVTPGDRVRLTAIMLPPPEPVAPGAFDFARQAYFDRLGAVGFAVSDVALVHATPDMGIARRIQALRERIAGRIRSVLPEESGAVAVALLTGLRSGLPADVEEAMREAGLAHLLAISGLHVGLVAGAVFFVIRAGIACLPAIALLVDPKRLAAILAWAVAGLYVLLAGATIPTLRAFLMTSLVLLAILLGRQAISLRLVAFAATAILVFAPESLLSVSFQMSFAAVIALVAVYEVLAPKLGRWASRAGASRSGWGRRIALYFLGIVLTTIIAEIAIGPFAAFHFHQIVTLGLLANLVAVPVMAFWIMPLGLVALVLMPLGLDGWALSAMALGLQVVISTARDVTAIPGHVLAIPAMPLAAIMAISLGGLWACLWRSAQLKWLGAIPITAGLILAVTARPPDILVGRDADLVGLRTPYGLHISARSGRSYEVERWLERTAGADLSFWPRTSSWREATPPTACDSDGCLIRLSGQPGLMVMALSQHPSALVDDCARADIVISWVPVRRTCPNPRVVIGRFDIWRDGAHAIWIGADGGIDVESVSQSRGIRPWSQPPR